ncbi:MULTISPECIES: non-homologous end-joining DNA ligase [Aestuariimicrobium]|uniref:non-homologous end-joining DNA ligase n=1 Tax=Aestuariimicrobium TaxID=396388 RepID=UPI0003B5FFEE|nr:MULTISPECIES: non-homologous end-joining DNA ligase [Aestuariimicrobium]CAI9410743.1 Multifunctional non-homologous end joining DNA repair protein LigD [Aestuariimicrobium sp. T2.26MG-19.2B]
MPAESEGLRTEVDGHVLTLTNLDKVLFPDGTTKAELIDYHVAIAPTLLPHLAGRCITRLRFPNGADAESFYEKNAPAGTPEWVHIQQVLAAGSRIDYVVADDAATLVWLANLAAIELHTPQWRLGDSPTGAGEPIGFDGENSVRATTLVVDLDPGPGISAHQLAAAAMMAATELAGEGLVPFVKTTGSKGLQVMAPIEPSAWREVVDQVRILGLRLARARPDLFVITMNKAARPERIYVDHLQNRADRNTISVYSARGRAEPRVSTPLTWDEVAAVGPGDELHFTIRDVPERVATLGDVWEHLLDPEVAAPLPRFVAPEQ